MEKYRYSPVINCLNWAFALIVTFATVLIISAIAGKLDFVSMRKPFAFCLGLWFVMIHRFNKQYTECYVSFSDEYITFNSFKIAYKIRNVNVRYEDIIGLYAKTVPVLGMRAVIVKAKNLPGDITVTWRMVKHKELFLKLYDSAKSTGETEYIDEKLVRMSEERYE